MPTNLVVDWEDWEDCEKDQIAACNDYDTISKEASTRREVRQLKKMEIMGYHNHRDSPHYHHLVQVRQKVKMEMVDRNSLYGKPEEDWEGAVAVDKNSVYGK